MRSPIPTKTLAWGSAVAVLVPACAPRLEWEIPLETRASGLPVAGVEVAVGGRFVGVTGAGGTISVPVEGAPGASLRVEARDPSVERLLRPASAVVVLPSFRAWLSGAGLSGRSVLAALPLQLETLHGTSNDEAATRGDPGEGDQVPSQAANEGGAGAGTESDIPDTNEGRSEPGSSGAAGAPSIAGDGAPARPGGATATNDPRQGNSPGRADAEGAVAGRPGPAESIHPGGKDGPAKAKALAGKDAAAPGGAAVADGGAAGVVARDAGEGKGSAGSGGVDAEGNSPGDAGSRAVPRVAPPLGPLSLVVEVFSEGKPVPGAEAYSVRRASGRIVRLGESDARGVLESDHPGALLGESLLVRHPCCVSLQRPLPAPLPLPVPAAGARTGATPAPAPARRVRVDLAPGVSHDFVAVQSAYGVPRVVEKVSISQGGRTLDLTGPTGVALIGRKNLAQGLVALDVSAPDALPSRQAVAFEIKATSEERPFVISLARSTPRPPNVGMLEMVRGEVVHAESHLQGEPLYRRARRDFLSRFVQEKSFRPLIFQEVKRLAGAASIEPTRLARRGWEMGPLAGEIDFLAVLEPSEGATGLAVRVLDAAGNVAWRGVFPYDGDGAPPEAAGRGAFEGLVAALPFEFAVSATDPVRLAAGADENRVVAAGDVFSRVATASSGAGVPGLGGRASEGDEGDGEGPRAGAARAADPGGPCEGRVARDGVTLALEAECVPAVAVGDVFARKVKARVAAKGGEAKGR